MSAIGVIAFLAVAACRKEPASPVAKDYRVPIVLFGVDGMEWDIVLRMIREDRLPEIEALIKRGSYGLLESMRPTSSPILWTSIATGKVMDKHGIRGFVVRKRKGVDRRLYTNADRKTKAFWNIYSDYGKTVHSIGWWLTFPVEPVRGIMVTQTNTLHWTNWQGTLLPNVKGQVYPPARQKEMMDVVKDMDERFPKLVKETFEGVEADHDDAVRKHLEKVKWALRADSIYETIAMKLAREGNTPDVTALYFGGTDVVQHMFWYHMEPESQPESDRPSAEDIRLLGRVIPDYYTHVDKAIGELLKLYPKKTTVIILADHGMTALGHHTNPPPAGFFLAAGPHIRTMPGKKPRQLKRSDLIIVGSVLDVTPTLLAMKNIPVGMDMDGKIMEAILSPVVLSQKRPSPVPTHDTPQWLASRPKIEKGEDIDPEREEQLRSLGYIN